MAVARRCSRRWRIRAWTLICPWDSWRIAGWSWSDLRIGFGRAWRSMKSYLSFVRMRLAMAGNANASKKARRRKDCIGIGIPPREYESGPKRPPAPPIGIKTSQNQLEGAVRRGLSVDLLYLTRGGAMQHWACSPVPKSEGPGSPSGRARQSPSSRPAVGPYRSRPGEPLAASQS